MRIAVIDEHTMTTSKTTVKAKWNDDLRRFTQPTADLTYAYLLARISELFVIPVSQIKLTYVDSDLDAISICCEKDVLEVIKASKGESPLRLNVSSVPIDGEPNESEDDEAWTLMGTGTPPTNEESPVGRPESPVLQTPSFHEMHADSFPAELDNTPPQSDGPGPAVAESNEGSESLPALLDSREIPRRPRQCIDSDADSPVVQRQARSVSNIYPDLDGTSSVATKQVTTSIYEDAVCTGSSLTPSPTHSSGLYPDANEPYTAEASSSSASSTPPGASGTGTGAGDTPVDLCSSGSECARGTKDAGLGLVTQTKISAEPEAVETAAAAAATTGTGWDWADPFRTVASTVSRDASAPKPSSSRTDNAPFPESTEPISPQPHDSPVAATQLPSPLVLRCEDFEGQAQSQLEDEGTSQLSPALGSTGDSYTHVLSDSERSPSPSTSFTSIAPRLPSNPAASSSRTPTSPPVATVAQNIGLYPPVDNHAVTGCTNTDTSKVEENAGASVYPDYSFSGVAADTDLDAVASEAHAAADSVVLAPGAVENESEGESHADVAGAVPAAVGADTNNIPQVTWMEHVVNEGHFHRLILQTRLEHEYNQKLRPTVWIIARAVADKMRAAGTYTEAQLQTLVETITTVLSSAVHDAHFTTPNPYYHEEAIISAPAPPQEALSTSSSTSDVDIQVESIVDEVVADVQRQLIESEDDTDSDTEVHKTTTTRSTSCSSVTSSGDLATRFPSDAESMTLSRSSYGLPLGASGSSCQDSGATIPPNWPKMGAINDTTPPQPAASVVREDTSTVDCNSNNGAGAQTAAWAQVRAAARAQDLAELRRRSETQVDSNQPDDCVAVTMQERYRREAAAQEMANRQFDNDMIRFGAEMQVLLDMDFADAADNIRLLREYDGNVQVVVNRLLN